jgi:2-polyprenyl-6-methoxyphenol hydroxylase-like FAD-dependent oxidoreductase
MTRGPRALVVGGSVGGLIAAHLLRAIGWHVIVFERSSEELADRGAAIGLTQELIDVMLRIGLRLDASISVEVRSFILLDHVGRITHEVPRRRLISAWGHIYRLLKDALPSSCYCSAMVLDRIEQDAQSVMAIFADGSRAQGDLLIGADGIHSTVRRQFLPSVQPRYAGYVLWRGLVEEADISPADRAMIFDHLTFCFAEREMMLCIPIPADGAGHRRCCFVWYRTADEETALRDLCTDTIGRFYGNSIPPSLIRPEVIDELKTSADSLFAPAISRIVARVEKPLLQAIFDLESPRMIFGRVALLGDAAFVARPHAVAGVTKAALDARCLADSLNRSDVHLKGGLARYERDRRRFGSELVAYARTLGVHLEAQPNTGRPHLRPWQPEIIMRNYGAPHALRKPEMAVMRKDTNETEPSQ